MWTPFVIPKSDVDIAGWGEERLFAKTGPKDWKWLGWNEFKWTEKTGLVCRMFPDPSQDHWGRFGWLERWHRRYLCLGIGRKGPGRRLEITSGKGKGPRLSPEKACRIWVRSGWLGRWHGWKGQGD